MNFKKLSLFLLPICLLTSCNNSSGVERNYEDYSKYNLTSLDNFYTMESNEYYVYLYSDVCPHCKSIKNDVLYFFDYKETNNEPNINMYIYNMKSSSTEDGAINRSKFKNKGDSYNEETLINEMYTNKPTTTKETYFFGIPVLFKIKDNHFEGIYSGTNEVLTELKQYTEKEQKDVLYTSILLVSVVIILAIIYSLIFKNKKKN